MQNTSEEYLDSLLASMNQSEDADNQEAEGSEDNTQNRVETQDDRRRDREILSDDDIILSESDINDLQAMIDDVEDYSLEERKENDNGEEPDETDSTNTTEEQIQQEEDSDIELTMGEPTVDVKFADLKESTEDILADAVSINEEMNSKTAEENLNIHENDIDDSMSEIMQMLNSGSETEAEENDDISVEELLRQAELADGGQEIKQLINEGQIERQEEQSIEERDLGDILGMLGEEDSDLAEIGTILKKSDNNEAIEDEMLSLLEGKEGNKEEQGMFDNSIVLNDSLEQEEKIDKEKSKKREKKKKKKKSDTDESLIDSNDKSEAGEDEFDDDDDFLASLFKKKPKKEKKKKLKKGESVPQSEEAVDPAKTNAELEAEMEKEDKIDVKKQEKERKKKEKSAARLAKKKSKQDKRDEKYAYLDKGKKISNKAIVGTFAVCFSLMAVLIIAVLFFPAQTNLKRARESFYQQNYQDVINRLYGKKLNDSDQLLLEKAALIYEITLKENAYYNYKRSNEDIKAVDAILQSAKRAKEAQRDAVKYGMEEELNEVSRRINSELLTEYQLSKEEVEILIAYPSLEYTYALRAIVQGEEFLAKDEVLQEEEPATEELQDVLPEELEYLDQ